MRANRFMVWVGVAAAGLLAGAAQADYVTVGHLGNAGELSGAGAGGYGPDTIVGGVAYEYQISEYEVTAGEYTAFLNAVSSPGTPNPYGLYNSSMWSNTFGCKIQDLGSGTYSVAGDWADRPVNYVSWYDAARYCNWLTTNDTETGVYDTSAPGWGSPDASDYTGFVDHELAAATYGTAYFLPTEDEWYKAAYYDGLGGVYYDYPTGSDTAPSNALIDPDPGNNATFRDSGYTIGSPYYRTEVGAHENSASFYGTYDQGGNVWEWNETLIGSSRGVRGGSFYSVGSLRADIRFNFVPTYEDIGVGFRVASSRTLGGSTVIPEPGSLGLLIVGLAGVVARRRRVAR